jgi:glycosyltransferase involved in cell wall biosynthesis
MRIAAFTAIDLSLPQGHALHLRGLFDALAARGHDLTLVTPRPAAPAAPAAFRRVHVPIVRLRVLGPWSFELFGGIALLFHCLRRRPDLIYARQDLYTVAPGLVSRMTGIPLAVEVNSEIGEELAIAGTNALARRLVDAAERITLRRAARILVLAERIAQQVRRRTGCDPARIAISPIATHLPERVDPSVVRERLKVNPSAFVIGFAGNLWPVQGVTILLDAFARVDLPDAELWVIGTGVHDTILRRRAAAIGRGPIRFFGGLPRDDADRLLASAQILVAPYVREEYDRIAGGPISTKILTYLASDRPVLVSDIPYYDWIAQIGAGGSFPSGDAPALAGQIAEWFARWRADGSPLHDWPWSAPGPGRRYVEEGHTWDHAAKRVEQILMEVGEPSGRPSGAAKATSSARPARSQAR